MGAALSGTLDEVEQVVKIVKEEHQRAIAANELPKEQTLVLVSSVMSWVNTPKKVVPTVPKKQEEQQPATQRSSAVTSPRLKDDESETEEDPDYPGHKTLYFLDKEFNVRSPSPKYQQVKTIETLAISAQRVSRQLKVYVLCAGLQYGNGESNDIFYEFFRSAWLSLHPDLASLPIVGSGKNRIPTIHVVDLARCVKHLLTLPPVPLHLKPQQYFFAVDQAKAQT
jgi:hypothetical protein